MNSIWAGSTGLCTSPTSSPCTTYHPSHHFSTSSFVHMHHFPISPNHTRHRLSYQPHIISRTNDTIFQTITDTSQRKSIRSSLPISTTANTSITSLVLGLPRSTLERYSPGSNYSSTVDHLHFTHSGENKISPAKQVPTRRHKRRFTLPDGRKESLLEERKD